MRYLPFLLIAALALQACRNDAPANTAADIHVLEGQTMGTYYRVSYRGDAQEGLQSGIDSVLVALNQEVSTYIPESFISRFNSSDTLTLSRTDLAGAPHFLANLQLSLPIVTTTQGYFNPLVMPVVNYWGFGYTPKKPVTQVDSAAVDSLMRFVNWDNLQFSTSEVRLHKRVPGTQLDFSAVAKGYGVDLVAAFLQAKGITNYLVDIGGEVVARGDKGTPDQPWRVGIAVPLESAAPSDYQQAVPLRDIAIATSGNYRNYYEVEGQKYSHTIDPFTGYPVRSHLLSASIMAADCATADAYATACMAAGLERAYTMIDTLPGLEGYFIFSDEAGNMDVKMTPGFKAVLDEE